MEGFDDKSHYGPQRVNSEIIIEDLNGNTPLVTIFAKTYSL